TSTPHSAISHLSLHDALPISLEAANGEVLRLEYQMQLGSVPKRVVGIRQGEQMLLTRTQGDSTDQETVPFPAGIGGYFAVEQSLDRKSTRLNSSHVKIAYAVF